MMDHRAALRQQLIRHEDLRLTPYRCPAGALTWGVGYNLTARGLWPLEQTLGRKVDFLELLAGRGCTATDALRQLDADIDECVLDLAAGFPWFAALDPVRQRVLVDMRFNLGPQRFRKFRNTLAAAARGDYAKTANGMRASLWYRQVKERGRTLVRWMRTGSDV